MESYGLLMLARYSEALILLDQIDEVLQKYPAIDTVRIEILKLKKLMIGLGVQIQF